MNREYELHISCGNDNGVMFFSHIDEARRWAYRFKSGEEAIPFNEMHILECIGYEEDLNHKDGERPIFIHIEAIYGK